MPWKLSAWQQWPFPHAHSATRFPCQWWSRVVPHTSSVVLSRPVLLLFQISSVAASATPADALMCKLKTSWKWFKLPNFKARSELALGFWWHISPHVTYKKLMLQGYFLTKDHFHICDVCAWSYGKGWSLSAWLLFPTCKWWNMTVFPRIWLRPAIPHPSMHFSISSACTPT